MYSSQLYLSKYQDLKIILFFFRKEERNDSHLWCDYICYILQGSLYETLKIYRAF